MGPSSKKTYDTSDLSKPGYYIVNPAGAVHECTRDHAQKRLKQVGWRLATDHEIEMYHEVHERTTRKARVKGKPVMIEVAGPGKKAGRPIAEPYSDDPDEILKDRAEKALADAEAGSEASEGEGEQDNSKPEAKTPEPKKSRKEIKAEQKAQAEADAEAEAEAKQEAEAEENAPQGSEANPMEIKPEGQEIVISGGGDGTESEGSESENGS